jgi:hypothetical protein
LRSIRFFFFSKNSVARICELGRLSFACVCIVHRISYLTITSIELSLASTRRVVGAFFGAPRL